MSNTDWEKYAIVALETEDIDIKKTLLEKSVDSKPDQAWPYYKLIGLLEDQPLQNIKLFQESKKIEFSEWYFLILTEYKLLLSIIYNEISKIEEELELLDPLKITSPFIFLPYIKQMSISGKISDEELEQQINNFIDRTIPEDDQKLIFNSIKNFISLKKYNINSHEFKNPIICENIEQKNNNINSLLAWIAND